MKLGHGISIQRRMAKIIWTQMKTACSITYQHNDIRYEDITLANVHAKKYSALQKSESDIKDVNRCEIE